MKLRYLFLTLWWAGLLNAAELHVAVGGKDDGPGSTAQPLATLDGARKKVQALRQAGEKRTVTVLFHAGDYPIAEPVIFKAEDSGLPGGKTVYAAAEGEEVRIHGGRMIGGWTKGPGSLWLTRLPADIGKFRELYVNGRAKTRARIPNTGFLRVASCPEGTPKTANYHKDCQVFGFAPGDIRADWRNLHDVEVVVYHFWTDSHLPILSVNSQSNLVTFAHKAGKTFTDDFSEEGARYIVENVFEGLDSPGEWYFDRETRELFYFPEAGEQMETAKVVIPLAPALLRFEGVPGASAFVSHLRFEGLRFSHVGFTLPPGNSNDQQGSASIPAAVVLKGARDLVFENCEFSRLGTWAIELLAGSSHNTFRANRVWDVAAGGFRINGGTEKSHPLERTSNNVVEDNEVGPYGRDFPSAVGVLLMNTAGNRVAHNEIHHGGYTGVSAGWVWGYQRSVARDNTIESNHIHHIGGILSDMGGIYTLGPSPGTVLRGNFIHHVDANHYGGWGIYHDEGSTGILVENNVVYATKFAGFNIHFAKEIAVRNNVFALGRLEQVSRSRAEPHLSVFFENNIVYWKEGDLMKGNWKDVPYTFYFHPKDKSGTRQVTNTFDMDWNVYWNPGSKSGEVKFAGETLEQWRGRGKDIHSIYEDPLFEDPDRGDFRLKPGSPAFRLGIQPVDTSRVGPRRKVGPSA